MDKEVLCIIGTILAISVGAFSFYKFLDTLSDIAAGVWKFRRKWITHVLLMVYNVTFAASIWAAITINSSNKKIQVYIPTKVPFEIDTTVTFSGGAKDTEYVYIIGGESFGKRYKK